MRVVIEAYRLGGCEAYIDDDGLGVVLISLSRVAVNAKSFLLECDCLKSPCWDRCISTILPR